MSEKRIARVQYIYHFKGNLLAICQSCAAVNFGLCPCKDPRFFTPEQCVQMFGHDGIPVVEFERLDAPDPIFSERQFS